MSNIIKVNLTIELEGCTLVRQGKELVKEPVRYWNPNTKKVDTRVVTFEKDKFEKKPAYQVLRISEDAYKYMTSLENVQKNPREWARMSKKQRLEFHLTKISQSLGGINFTYVILED